MTPSVTPADQARIHEQIAAEHLAAATRLAQKYADHPSLPALVRDAGTTVRLLLVGAITDPQVSSVQGRHLVRAHLRDLAHDDTRPKGVTALYRRCLNALDGKE